MRLAVLSWLGLIFAAEGICQVVSPPQFYPYTGPTAAYPNTQIIFELKAIGGYQYEFLESPTNSHLSLDGDAHGGGFGALITWLTPPRSTVGTTHQFVVRATGGDYSTLSSTGVVRFVVIDVPPIRSIIRSNGVSLLQFDNPLPIQPLVVQWTDTLPTTNWMQLTVVYSAAASIAVTDTNPPAAQRFYRLIPYGSSWCYGYNCP